LESRVLSQEKRAWKGGGLKRGDIKKLLRKELRGPGAATKPKTSGKEEGVDPVRRLGGVGVTGAKKETTT